MGRSRTRIGARLLLLAAGAAGCRATAPAGPLDLAILNARVMDPETGLDAVRNVGVAAGRVEVVTQGPLAAREVVDARGLVVAPGFIDLHVHGQDATAYALKAQDGVTTALELEIGTGDVERFYAERAGKAVIHFGASIGHVPVRMAVMGDAAAFLPPATSAAATRPATDAEIADVRRRIREGLAAGAPAVGMGIQYTPAASRWEILEVFREAAAAGASVHVHMRHNGVVEPASSTTALSEVIAAAAITGAPLHVVHIHSTSVRLTPRHLQMIDEARRRGLDVTTECYPYTFGMTDISSGVFNDGWREALGIDYDGLQLVATGERLTAESFARLRSTGGLVAVHSIPEAAVRAAIAHPLVMIASDGILEGRKGHPRTAGTYARLLGHYVRAERVLPLMEALRKITLMPAERLARQTPAMKRKGRVQPGADADLVALDPDRVIDRATFEDPTRASDGIRHVWVGGVAVVKDGALRSDATPGVGIRGTPSAEARGRRPLTSLAGSRASTPRGAASALPRR